MANTFINPELFQAGVEAKLESKRNLLPLVQSESITGVQAGKINLISNVYDAEAEEVAPGKQIPIKNLKQAEVEVEFKKIAVGHKILDEEVNRGFGDPIGFAETSLAKAIDVYQDKEVAGLLDSATKFNVEGEVTSDTIIDSIAMFGDEFTNGENFLVMSPANYGKLQKSLAKTNTTLELQNNPYGVQIILSSHVGDNAYLVQEGAIKEFVEQAVEIEPERNAGTKSTDVYGSKMYGVQLYDESKVVGIKPATEGPEA